MADKNIYANDLKHRFPRHTFTETTVQSETLVKFKDSNSAVIRKAQNLVIVDAYRKIRNDLLETEIPLFLSTTTERDNLKMTMIDRGITIYNITINEDETWNGTAWIAAGGENGPVVHLPVAEITTADNVQTVINKQTLDANSVYMIKAEIVGCLPNHTSVASFNIEGTVKRVGSGSAVFVGAITTIHSAKDSGASSWNVTFTVSGNDVRVSVTGANATTINWKSDFDYLKH